MVINRKAFLLIVASLIVVSLLGVWFLNTAKSIDAGVHSRVFSVVIDAGHGGIDGGAEGTNTSVKESDLNLEIARHLKSKFQDIGVNVIMTRNSYGGLYGTTAKGFKKRDLEKRVKIINSSNADVLVSIHLNCYSSPKRRGATVFFGEGKQEGERLAKSVQKHFNTLSAQPKDYSATRGDYYLLNQAKIPAVICECGFLSSPEDEKLLLTEVYQKEIAEKIFYGVIEYLSLQGE